MDSMSNKELISSLVESQRDEWAQSRYVSELKLERDELSASAAALKDANEGYESAVERNAEHLMAVQKLRLTVTELNLKLSQAKDALAVVTSQHELIQKEVTRYEMLVVQIRSASNTIQLLTEGVDTRK
tara:strand:+ start:1553 stop:1939 length:387 start_codon:yes stop_codon:yes gene_type:complete